MYGARSSVEECSLLWLRLFLEISSMRGFNLSIMLPGSPSSSGDEDDNLGVDLITRTAKVRA